MELYLISPPRKPFLDQLVPVLRAGVDRFQYRRPGLNDRAALEELLEVRSRTEQVGVPLVVNDRPDRALLADAEGVHLGDEDLPVGPVKNQWPSLTVGRTQRVEDPIPGKADHLGVGPVFPTSSKSVDAGDAGWEGVSDLLGRTAKQVYAVGGITPERCENVPDGLTGVAVIGAVWAADDPVRAVRDFKQRLGES